MSTKRLSRTVLEKGKHNGNKYDCKYSHRIERNAERRYCALVQRDCELADELIEPQIKPIYREFTDKLSPVYAWIEKQVGKNWADIRRDLKEKFDDRTLAGYHVVHQHIFAEIDGSGGQEHSWNRAWYIDGYNILRRRHEEGKTKYSRWRDYSERYESYKTEPFDDEQRDELVEWLDRRKVRFYDGVLYWVLPSEGGKVVHQKRGWYNLLHYEWSVATGYDFVNGFHIHSKIKWRKGYKLDRHEVNYFRALPLWVRAEVLFAGKE